MKKLAAKKLLTKTHSPVEERLVVIDLTAQGIQAVENFISHENSGFSELLPFFEEMTESDIHTMERFFRIMENIYRRKLE